MHITFSRHTIQESIGDHLGIPPAYLQQILAERAHVVVRESGLNGERYKYCIVWDRHRAEALLVVLGRGSGDPELHWNVVTLYPVKPGKTKRAVCDASEVSHEFCITRKHIDAAREYERQFFIRSCKLPRKS